jgi:hypothetical protein
MLRRKATLPQPCRWAILKGIARVFFFEGSFTTRSDRMPDIVLIFGKDT